MIRTLNNAVRSMLFQAQMSPSYWVGALHTAAHIINILSSASISNKIPSSILFGREPSYHHLRVFGCLCFQNTNHFMKSKLSPRSTPCLFLCYPTNHKGYRCIDLKSNRIILSRHVVFDETIFLAAEKQKAQTRPYQFLESADTQSSLFRSILQNEPSVQAPGNSISLVTTTNITNTAPT